MNKKPVFAYVVLGLLGFSLFVLVGYVMIKRAEMDPSFQSYDQTRAAFRAENLAKLQASEKAQLTSYGWVDQSKGTARMPIEKAMELEVDALKAKPVKAAAVIQIPAAAPAPVPSPASAPAPAAAGAVSAPVVPPAAAPATTTPSTVVAPAPAPTSVTPAVAPEAPAPTKAPAPKKQSKKKSQGAA